MGKKRKEMDIMDPVDEESHEKAQPKKKKKKKSKHKEEEDEPVIVPEPSSSVEESTSSQKKKKKKSKKDKKSKKSKKSKTTRSDSSDDDADVNSTKGVKPIVIEEKTPAVETNHTRMFTESKITSTAHVESGCKRVFLGNLSFKITDQLVKDFFNTVGEVEHIEWLTDKETGNFYGSGFAEFTTVQAALDAVDMSGTELLGRPIKVRIAPPKEGSTGRNLAQKKEKPKNGDIFKGKALSERPIGCTKLFLGNLSFDIDDDGIHEFFKDCGEIIGIRWLSHRDTGDFKGCGFVTFNKEEAVDKAVLKNGTVLLGRPIRIDYTT